MNKLFGSVLLIIACCTQANAEDGRTTASAPAASPAAQAGNANDAFCSAGTPCEVNRRRAGDHH